ncbi:DEAD/DEAH box helicase, partial [Streptomyces sp. BG9H]
MNRSTRTNGRQGSPRSSGGFRSSEGSRSGGGPRSGGPRSGGRSYSKGPSRRPAALQGEFALPVTVTPALPPVEDFAALGLPDGVVQTLTRLGVTQPFPIQAATLPNSLAGRDVLGRGRTGSGKTLAFGLAVLARTAGQRAEPRRPLALVLAPTRA